MNGGFDAVLRNFFGTTLEYRVRMSLKELLLSIGEARAIQTAHNKINWLIVSPTVSIAADGLSGHASVAYSAAYNAVIEANRVGAKSLGMTGLGTGAAQRLRRRFPLAGVTTAVLQPDGSTGVQPLAGEGFQSNH